MNDLAELHEWLRHGTDHPPGRTTGALLAEHWGGRSGQMSLADAKLLALAMDLFDVCFEPDVRFSGHIIRPADTVIFYEAEDGIGFGQTPSTAYLAAATIARLGVIVASADGAVVPAEQAILRERTSRAIDLSPTERRRLEAYVEWLLDTPIALDALEGEGTGLDAASCLRIGRFLVAVAGADGYISAPERWMLAGTFSLFGLSDAQLQAEIDSFAAAHEPAPEPNRTALSPAALETAIADGGGVIDELGGLMPIVPMTSTRLRHMVAEPSADYDAPETMEAWEAALAAQWSGLAAPERVRAGSLLALVPKRQRWETFVAGWKAWPLPYWLAHQDEFPHALAVLFGGFAFFEYDETSFWPQLTRDLWVMSEAQRGALRTAHARSLERLGLPMVRNQSDDRMTVSSAVHHIGVPLSLWADFLDVADHILAQPDWSEWTSGHWAADVTARCGPRVRLRNFLTANEASARETIHELGEIRDYARADPTSTIEDLAGVANVPFLRDEYFDDVPETAEFFRPDNLLSLFAGRCFLRYDEERGRLQIHLPGVSDPTGSVWSAGSHEQAALREPSWFTVDGDGFTRWIEVHLDGPAGRRTRKVSGVTDWALYDHRREAFLDLDLRHSSERRMGDYLLVSPHPLTHMTRRGFITEFPENDPQRLADGTRCYVTRLSPAAADGSLSLRWAAENGSLQAYTVLFKSRVTTRPRTMLINGVERPMPDPSLPWYFLRPGPYPPITYAALTKMELTKMNTQGSASAFERMRRYTAEGVIVSRADGAWMLGHERARVERAAGNVEVWLLGLPSHMWALGGELEPATIEIVGDGGLTYLHGVWPAAHEGWLLRKLEAFGVGVERA